MGADRTGDRTGEAPQSARKRPHPVTGGGVVSLCLDHSVNVESLPDPERTKSAPPTRAVAQAGGALSQHRGNNRTRWANSSRVSPHSSHQRAPQRGQAIQ